MNPGPAATTSVAFAWIPACKGEWFRKGPRVHVGIPSTIAPERPYKHQDPNTVYIYIYIEGESTWYRVYGICHIVHGI